MIFSIKNIRLFKESYNTYNKANNSIEMDLKEFEFYKNIELKWKNENFVSSFKNNFFSLLMTSLLIESCQKNNLIDYLKIITCIRQCVTSTDNIIDNEDKGVIFIDNMSNKIVKNTLLVMVSQNIIESSSIELLGDTRISKEILNSIYKIAQAESKRDIDLYSSYPNSEYIKDVIHKGIGGELLEIAMVAPSLTEPSKKLSDFSKGLFEIGMALQALDDLCDITEDLEEGKVNYALAKLIEDGYSIEEIKSKDYIVPTSFNKIYLEEVLEKAYNGFDYLILNNFPLKRKEIKFLLKHLFKIRGLGGMWKLVEGE